MREIKKYVRFYIQKRTIWADQSSQRPRNVVMIFNYNGNRLCTPTGMKVAECDWDKNRQRVKLNVKRANEVNAYLSGIEDKVNDIYFSSIAQGIIPNNNQILKQMRKEKQTEKPSFLAEWKKYLEVRKSSLKPSSIEALRHSFEHFERFAKGQRIEFDDVNGELMSKYADYLLKLGHVDNTRHKHIKRLRAFMAYAKRAELHNNDRFKNFNIPERTGRIVFLDWDEVKVLLDYKPENSVEQRVLDNFLFGCLTAMRFSDYHALKPSDIVSVTFKDIPEVFWGIKYRQLKTDKTTSVPVLPETLAIIERNKNNKEGFVLPRADSQLINRVIKDIAKKAGITQKMPVDTYKDGKRSTEYFEKWELMSTHIGRKTFISAGAIKGLPINMVAEIAGHSIKTCMKFYAGVAEKEKFKQVMKEMKFTEPKKKQPKKKSKKKSR